MCRRQLVSQTVDEFTGGVMSMGEHDFARLCREYGIRPPTGRWRKARGAAASSTPTGMPKVVVEIDGAGHADVEVMRDDHERQNDIVLSG